MKAPELLEWTAGSTTATDATVRFRTRLVDRTRPSWHFTVRTYENETSRAVYVFPDGGWAPGILHVPAPRSRDGRRANHIHALAAWVERHADELGTYQEVGQWATRALPYKGNGALWEVWIPLDVRDASGKPGTETYLRGRR